MGKGELGGRLADCQKPVKRGVLVLALVLPGAAQAERTPAPESDGATSIAAPTANLLGLSLAYQAPLDLDKSFPLGGGLFYTREYFVTPRTALGIHAAVRIFPQEPWHLALGYGLTLKHYVGNWGTTSSDGAYVLYGLLLQMNFLEGHRGSATGHDTRLSVGYDWGASPVAPFVEAGFHLTQVRAFNEDTLYWPYSELVTGLRF